ncbi:MAG: GNAT family N-acetyltransferase [Defluviitaleaceae bacterium]|nr:GNAT family N-acetyltransferase [Defluviitaleaceae bacterium]
MVELRKIDSDNYEEVWKLRSLDNQKGYKDTVEEDFATAYLELLEGDHPPMFLAIYNGEEIVGYTLILYYELCEDNAHCEEFEILRKDFGDKAIYEFGSFMIDAKHQGKGLGRQAMEKILEYIHSSPQGEADSIFLICKTENKTAEKLFTSYGFADVGKQVFGGEKIMRAGLGLAPTQPKDALTHNCKH